MLFLKKKKTKIIYCFFVSQHVFPFKNQKKITMYFFLLCCFLLEINFCYFLFFQKLGVAQKGQGRNHVTTTTTKTLWLKLRLHWQHVSMFCVIFCFFSLSDRQQTMNHVISKKIKRTRFICFTTLSPFQKSKKSPCTFFSCVVPFRNQLLLFFVFPKTAQ